MGNRGLKLKNINEENNGYGGDVLAVALGQSIKEGRVKSIIIFALFVVLVVSIVGNYVQFNYLPQTKVVTQTVDGRILPIPTLDEPVLSDARVLNWSAEKFEKLYDMDFTDISSLPSRLSLFMLPGAKDQFIQGIRDAGIIDKVISERLVAKAIRTAPPSLTNSYIKKGRYIWVIEMPMSIIFEGTGGSSGREVQNIVVRGRVGREHIMKSDDGVVIGSVEIWPGKG